MNTPTHKCKCAVCGARIEGLPNNGVNTCDGVCSRAQASGRTRGKQMELEVRNAANLKPIDPAPLTIVGLTGFGYHTGDEYNRPYNWMDA